MLDGYTFPVIPQLLSEQRVPQNGNHTAALVLACRPQSVEALLFSMAYVLGIWADTRDVVLVHFRHECGQLVRIRWSSDQTWGEALAGIVLSSKLSSNQDSILQSFVTRSPALTYDRGASHKAPGLITLFWDKADYLELTAPLHAFSSSVSATYLHLINAVLHTLQKRYYCPLSAGLSDVPDSCLSVDDRRSEQLEGYTPVTYWVQVQAETRPNAIAVFYYESVTPNANPNTLTFKELEDRSSQMAHYLCRLNVSLGDRVAVCMRRDPNFHICFLAILKAGACYVPVSVPSEHPS
jgi:hypothetical protein